MTTISHFRRISLLLIQRLKQLGQGKSSRGTDIANNAATAEESAASSEELSSQAEMLKAMVTRFKLRDSGSLKDPSIRLLASAAGADKRDADTPKILLSENENDKY